MQKKRRMPKFSVQNEKKPVRSNYMERWRFTLNWISMAMCLFGLGYGYASESIFWLVIGILGGVGFILSLVWNQLNT
jgi:hypothetical protein